MENVELKTSDLTDKEQMYSEIRTLRLQLLEAEESDDTALRRRANIEADRYLMENKSILMPILVDALAQQIRGIRAQEDMHKFIEGYNDFVHAARITEAEDMYESNTNEPIKKPLLARLFKRFDKAPEIQYVTQDRQIRAEVGHTVKLSDGRYGLVTVRHPNGLLEIQGSNGLFTALDSDLIIAVAPHPKATRTIK